MERGKKGFGIAQKIIPEIPGMTRRRDRGILGRGPGGFWERIPRALWEGLGNFGRGPGNSKGVWDPLKVLPGGEKKSQEFREFRERGKRGTQEFWGGVPAILEKGFENFGKDLRILRMRSQEFQRDLGSPKLLPGGREEPESSGSGERRGPAILGRGYRKFGKGSRSF